MQIIKGRPPNFEAIAAVLPAARGCDTIFTYGDTVYVSGNDQLPRSLIVHECVHITQQTAEGMTPEFWWECYLKSMKFRYRQELPAHQMEWKVAVSEGNRHERRAATARIAKRLSGPLYGHCCTMSQAKKLIQETPHDNAKADSNKRDGA